MPFRDRWLNQFGLPRRGWRKHVQHLRTLPFISLEDSEPLIRFLFDEVPDILAIHTDSDTPQLADALGWCCIAIWQCESGFPAFPENYAVFLRQQLCRSPKKRAREALVLAALILDGRGNDERCGFNRLRLAEPEIVRASERLMLEGGYEFYLNAQEKYDEYLCYLKSSDSFATDWKAIKRQFAEETSGKEIIHRSLLPERNWERGPGAQFADKRSRFQALFDFFCWKYFLWGMRGDHPLLMKPSVVFTPLGTQIFIPGYLSLDAKRDLDFSKIGRLHRARGLTRQGEGFSVGRQELIALRTKAKVANREALRTGLRGDARYDFIRKQLALPQETDYRRVRSLLQPL